MYGFIQLCPQIDLGSSSIQHYMKQFQNWISHSAIRKLKYDGHMASWNTSTIYVWDYFLMEYNIQMKISSVKKKKKKNRRNEPSGQNDQIKVYPLGKHHRVNILTMYYLVYPCSKEIL